MDNDSEYMEVLERKTNTVVAVNIAEVLLNNENVIRTEIFFTWGLIKEDGDDNKFVDCAIAANAKYIISNGRHFRILKEVEFPKIDVIGIEEFLESLRLWMLLFDLCFRNSISDSQNDWMARPKKNKNRPSSTVARLPSPTFAA